MRRAIDRWALGVAVTLGAACGDGGDHTIKERFPPQMVVHDGEREILPGSEILVRAGKSKLVIIENRGSSTLELRDIEVASSPPGVFAMSARPRPTPEHPAMIEPDGPTVTLELDYYPEMLGHATSPRANVLLSTNMTLDSTDELAFTVRPDPASRLVIMPATLDLPVGPVDSTTGTAFLLDTDAHDPVTIDRLLFLGEPGFSATIDGVEYRPLADPIALAPPLVIEPSGTAEVGVTYRGAAAELSAAQLMFFTPDDPTLPHGLTVFANATGACLETSPAGLDFGGRLVGASSRETLTIRTCGADDLVVSALTIDGNTAFSIEPGRLPELPITLRGADTLQVPIAYFPDSVAALDQGSPAIDRATLHVAANVLDGPRDVPITGFGTDGHCPTARIAIAEGDHVRLGQVLHLDGTGSLAPTVAWVDPIREYTWSVVAPTGSDADFDPDAYSATTTFEPDVAGSYLFRLTVHDAYHQASCTPAAALVGAHP